MDYFCVYVWALFKIDRKKWKSYVDSQMKRKFSKLWYWCTKTQSFIWSLMHSFSQYVLNKHLPCTRDSCRSYSDAAIMRKTSLVPTLTELTSQKGEGQIWKTRGNGEWHFKYSLEANKGRFTGQNVAERIVKWHRVPVEQGSILNALEPPFLHPLQGVRSWPWHKKDWTGNKECGESAKTRGVWDDDQTLTSPRVTGHLYSLHSL